jgi:hypothetical protein
MATRTEAPAAKDSRVSDDDAPGHDALQQAQPFSDGRSDARHPRRSRQPDVAEAMRGERQPDPEEPLAGGDAEPDLEAPEDDVAEQRESLHGAEHGGTAERSIELDPADAADEPVGDDDDEDDYR